MVYENVLVAYDGSDHARKALESALKMVDHGMTRKVIVLKVTQAYRGADVMLESASKMAGVDITTLTQIERDELGEDLAPLIKDHSGIVEAKVEIGVPKDEILKAAHDYDCSLIIIGSRGLGAIRGMLGSVSYAVLRDSPVPVLITK